MSPSRVLRRFAIPKAADPPVSAYARDADIKSHRDYAAAKAGDIAAAVRLVLDLVPTAAVSDARRRLGRDVIYVPVVAEELAGRNAIPSALAHFFAEATSAQATDEIVQSARAFHTGARPLERLGARAAFDGPVDAGRRYVIVDDVSVLGSTLAELANHVRGHGGDVAGVVVLVNAGRSAHLSPEPRLVRLVEKRHGEEIRNRLGIEPEALTAAEALYLAGFRDADQLRDSLAKAARERDRRLRQKGLRAPENDEDSR